MELPFQNTFCLAKFNKMIKQKELLLKNKNNKI